MILQGDARHIPLADESVQCVVTSPPYWGLRDYGIGEAGIGLEPTPELYVQHIVEVFREVRRVLRKDGTCWVNLGDSYDVQMAIASITDGATMQKYLVADGMRCGLSRKHCEYKQRQNIKYGSA